MSHTEEPWYAEHGAWGWSVRTKGRQFESVNGKNEDSYVAYKLKSKDDAELFAAAPKTLRRLESAIEVMEIWHKDLEPCSGCVVCSEIKAAKGE